VTGRPQSLWLKEALVDIGSPGEELVGACQADVAIVGGGYVGLWTAMELKRLQPAIRVVILEQDVCGSGASGRNGGYALSWWPKAPSLCKQWGREMARTMVRLSEQAIDEIELFCRAEMIDAEFRRCGWVWGAESEMYCGGWNPAIETCRDLGVGDFEILDRAAVAMRSGTTAFHAGMFDRTAALLQPAKLVRGMREVALRLGVRIFEHTSVNRFTRTCPVELKCTHGSVIAKVAVLATNAWAASVPELARSIAVVTSDMIASKPIPDRLKEIGWSDGAGVNGSQTMVDYVRTTVSGRVLAGKGGLASALGGRIHNGIFHSDRRAATVQSSFRRLYPAFADLSIDTSWAGPVDRTFDGMPMLGSLRGHENILFGIGWSGNGLGPSKIGGRILARLALGIRDELTSLPIVGPPRRDMPMEPIRFWGAQVIRSAVRRKDLAESSDRHPGPIVRALASLAPRGVED